MTELTLQEGKGRKQGVTAETRELRVKTSVNMKLQGRSYNSILIDLNKQAVDKHWGTISMSQLKKDIAKHFNYAVGYSVREATEIQEGEKQAYIAELERNIQTQYGLIVKAIHFYQNESKIIFDAELKNEKVNKPIYTRGQMNLAWQTLLNMNEHLSRVKGWDTNINLVQNNISNNIKFTYDRGIEDIRTLPDETKQGLEDFFEGFCNEGEVPDGQETIEGVVQPPDEVEVPEGVDKDIH